MSGNGAQTAASVGKLAKNPALSGGLGTVVALLGMVGADKGMDLFGRQASQGHIAALEDRIEGIKATHAETIETVARACNGQLKLGLEREARQQAVIEMLYDDIRRAAGIAAETGASGAVADVLEDAEARAIFEETE